MNKPPLHRLVRTATRSRLMRWVASALLLCVAAAPALERSKMPDDWPLAHIQYQLWSYEMDFTGMPMQMPARQFTNCVDRERASRCSFDDPNSPCKVTMLERVANTQKAVLECPNMKGAADFVWAPDGTSWAGSFQMEGQGIPPGVTMRLSAKYLRPCAEKDARR